MRRWIKKSKDRQRYYAYGKALVMGTRTVDEIRKMEGLS